MPLGRKAASMLRALDKFLVRGLGSIREETARDLAGFLRANGLGKAADRARQLRDPAPERRYRAFVELRIALEEAVVKLYRPGEGPPPRSQLVLAPDSISRVEDLRSLLEASRRFEATPAALAFLQTGPDLSGLDGEGVEALMGNDDLRQPAARLLRKSPAEQLSSWISHLTGSANRLSRQGCYLLAPGLPPEDATRLTRPSWIRPEDQDQAFEFFHPRRMECRRGLAEALLPDQDVSLEGRRFALRMVARSAREGEPEKWDGSLEEDPETAALLQIARFKAGEVDLDRVRSWSSSLDSRELRAIATLQCWLEGDAEPRAFAQEMQRSRDLLPLMLGPLRSTSRLDGLVKSWTASLSPARPVAERERALGEALASGDRRLATPFLKLLQDPSRSIREPLLPFLCSCLGLLPIRLSVDFAPLSQTPFEEFSSDVLHGFERSLLPSLERVPDVRLAPYVGYLLRRSGPEAVPAPGIRALGGALLPELEILLTSPDRRLQILALQELEALRGSPRAQAILDNHQAGRDPLENAVEKLLVPAQAPQGRSELDALERPQAVPRLLEMARTRKEAREPILEILTDWKSEETLPFLVRLLGSPLPDMVRGKPGARETRWMEKTTSDHFRAFGAIAAPTLEAALGSENWTVRHHAASLLGEIGLETSTPPIARALEHEEVEEVHSQLVASLGATGGPLAIEALEPLARSSQASNQMRAARSLSRIPLPEARQLLEELLAGAQDMAMKRFLRSALQGGDA